MDEGLSLRHSKWECKYHIVFIPKCRRRMLYGQLRNDLGVVFRALARHKESRIEVRSSDGRPCSYAEFLLDSSQAVTIIYLSMPESTSINVAAIQIHC